MTSPACRAPHLGSHRPRVDALVLQRRRRIMVVTNVIGVVMMGLLCPSAFSQDNENPTTPEGWYKRAYDKRHNRDFDGAIADATESIKLSPKTGKYWLERGISKGNKGDLEGALDDFNL